MPARQLTPRQAQVLALIDAALAVGKAPPTVRELGEALGGVFNNGVTGHLKALCKKGFLPWDQHKARTLEILQRRDGRYCLIAGQWYELILVTELTPA